MAKSERELKEQQEEFEKALRGELPCPDCGGPMPSPIQVTDMQSNGIPKSRYVCRHCHRQRNRKRRPGQGDRAMAVELGGWMQPAMV